MIFMKSIKLIMSLFLINGTLFGAEDEIKRLREDYENGRSEIEKYIVSLNKFDMQQAVIKNFLKKSFDNGQWVKYFKNYGDDVINDRVSLFFECMKSLEQKNTVQAVQSLMYQVGEIPDKFEKEMERIEEYMLKDFNKTIEDELKLSLKYQRDENGNLQVQYERLLNQFYKPYAQFKLEKMYKLWAQTIKKQFQRIFNKKMEEVKTRLDELSIKDGLEGMGKLDLNKK